MAFPTAAILDALGISRTVNTLPNAGQNAKVDSLGVVIASDDDIQPKLGIVTETPPASDTASSGLNGRLQRVAQRLTSLIAQIPASLGIKTAANSLSITHASDDAMAVALGGQVDTAATTDTGTFSLIALFKRALGYLSTIAGAAVDVTTPSPVKIDQTTPGTTNAVSVQTPADVLPFTPTLDTSAYAAGDVLFATASLGTVTRVNDGRAVLMSLTGIDKSKNKPAMTLLFYQTNVTSAAANAANALSDADQANLLGYVRILAADWIDYTNNSIVCKTSINLLLEAASGAQNVYAVGILDAGTPTFAASDLVFKLGLVQS